MEQNGALINYHEAEARGDEIAVGEDAVGSKSSSTAESTDLFVSVNQIWFLQTELHYEKCDYWDWPERLSIFGHT